MNWLERRRVKKYSESLSTEEKQKLKAHVAEIGITHCFHGIKYSSSIPCMNCMSESVYEGDITKIIPFF